MREVAERHGLPVFDVEPKVTLLLESASPSLRLRVPSRARKRGRVEQDILEAFLLRLEDEDTPFSPNALPASE